MRTTPLSKSSPRADRTAAFWKGALLALLLLSATLCAAESRSFDLRRDTFVFANETAWAYDIDAAGRLHIGTRETPPKYAHRCFVMTRAAIQFHQFARFDAARPRVSDDEYARLIRRVCRIPVWWPAPREPVVIPGYADLASFSKVKALLLQKHLGAWLPTYFRVGNWRMAMGHPRCGQAAAARWLERSMAEGKLRAIYIARFPHMNHALVAYRAERLAGGEVRYLCYDPNYPGQPRVLTYRTAERSFDFERVWYFPGGRVNVMRIYISPLH